MQYQHEKPITDDREMWKEYWAKEQPQEWFALWGYWRTEPEISQERQQFLRERLAIQPDIEKGIFPFAAIHLARADIEWLLAHLSNLHFVGPVSWSDPKQRNREGLDLRGADLRGCDLRALPLARTRGGLSQSEWTGTTEKQRDSAAARFDGDETVLNDAHLEGTQLGKCNFAGSQMKGAQLQGAYLRRARMEKTYLLQADLRGANLKQAHLEGAYLSEALLGGMPPSLLHPSGLAPADLREAFFDGATDFTHASLGDAKGGSIQVVDARWNTINLSLIDWASITRLGDEQVARFAPNQQGKDKVGNYSNAMRANRQLTALLRGQGLNDEADYFAYRAQLCQRAVFRLQRNIGRYFWSVFLDALAGYGYRPVRTLLIYLLVIASFSSAYVVFGSINHHTFTFHEALIFSLTSFHGRGFFPGGLALDDPITTIAAIEAIFGLLIEISFIATFTQRFLGK